ncbi:Swarming motility regulation sensor protein rssA [Morganella morganii]|nr:Swarming motility regulation sensor protein rssA [Morganella morganii]
MRIRSFFVYTVLLQTFSMLLLWGVWIAWLKYAYLPGLSEDFNAQQMVIARGVSDTLRETPTDSATFPQIARALESMYANAMKSGLEEENYDPLVAILHSTTGEVLYSNKPDVHIPLKPDGIERFTEDGETWYLAYNTDPDMQRTAVIGESGTDRHMLIGDPATGTAVPLLFILGTMLSSTIITTYLSLRPLRETTRSIATRNPRQPDTHQHEISVQ